MAITTTSFTNTSVTYKSDGTTIDVVCETTIDFNPPAGWTGTQAEFLEKCMPPRYRMFAEYFAGLSEEEREAEANGWPGQPAMDAGTLDAIDYVNENLYQVFRGAGITITSSGATCTHTREFAYAATGTATSGGAVSRGVISFAFAPVGTAAITPSGAISDSEVDRDAGSGAGGADFSGAAVDCTGAPKPPTTIAAADGVGESVVSWDTQEGAVSYKIYYVIDYVAQTEAQIIAAPTGSTNGTTPAGQTIGSLTAGHVYGFTVTATNATTESLGGTLDTATIT